MINSILITCLPDGTYHVKETGGEGADQSVKSPDEVVQLVQQYLQDDGQDDDGDEGSTQPGGLDDDAADAAGDDPSAPASDPKAAWQQEASTRDPASGLRK